MTMMGLDGKNYRSPFKVNMLYKLQKDIVANQCTALLPVALYMDTENAVKILSFRLDTHVTVAP